MSTGETTKMDTAEPDPESTIRFAVLRGVISDKYFRVGP